MNKWISRKYLVYSGISLTFFGLVFYLVLASLLPPLDYSLLQGFFLLLSVALLLTGLSFLLIYLLSLFFTWIKKK
ncbi:MAG: hypothetical protein GWN31_14225 [Candidatus Thorarchaeota archaeon]|nr:hypothetical protein [Candidatus Thorarchaeota archaeon]NIW15051.1 hypothetical protein [Candidatus Thorarchaeota archaeon]NIW53061.1 hypothetical protein [Candidatus Korarchaeota archaeon]